ncbi:MAG: Na+/H+ antiporter subunit E [Clostridia bacterium]
MKNYFPTLVFCFMVWILVAGTGYPELILGAAVSLVLALLLGKICGIRMSWKTPFSAILFIVLYVPVFLFELVKANIDVLFRVLNPKLPINPGFVRIETGVNEKFGKLILANSITLTPGTISVDADDDGGIYVHWINVTGADAGSRSEKISGRFERILKKVML